MSLLNRAGARTTGRPLAVPQHGATVASAQAACPERRQRALVSGTAYNLKAPRSSPARLRVADIEGREGTCPQTPYLVTDHSDSEPITGYLR